jgi:hypothetical protein
VDDLRAHASVHPHHLYLIRVVVVHAEVRDKCLRVVRKPREVEPARHLVHQVEGEHDGPVRGDHRKPRGVRAAPLADRVLDVKHRVPKHLHRVALGLPVHDDVGLRSIGPVPPCRCPFGRRELVAVLCGDVEREPRVPPAEAQVSLDPERLGDRVHVPDVADVEADAELVGRVGARLRECGPHELVVRLHVGEPQLADVVDDLASARGRKRAKGESS